jgi:hypothetical protein
MLPGLHLRDSSATHLRDTGPAEQASNDPPFAGTAEIRGNAGETPNRQRINRAHTPTTFEHSAKSVNGLSGHAYGLDHPDRQLWRITRLAHDAIQLLNQLMWPECR